MLTPGQLIRQQRLRRGWTQHELGAALGLSQANVSRYEAELRYPSWPMLCRLLGAMGMQPRVVAEPCDISLHEVSAWARSDLDERVHGTPTPWSDDDINLEDLLSPQVSETPIRLYHLLPLLELLRGLDFVLVGRVALRMHGIGCSVPRVDVQLQAEPAPDLWGCLGDRLDEGTIGVWSPFVDRYLWRPAQDLLVDIAALAMSGDPPVTQLSLRTRDTATEVRLRIGPTALPPFVVGGTSEHPVPLLAISELIGSGDEALAEAFRRILGKS